MSNEALMAEANTLQIQAREVANAPWVDVTIREFAGRVSKFLAHLPREAAERDKREAQAGTSMNDYTPPSMAEVRDYLTTPRGLSSLALAQAKALGEWLDEALAEHDRQVKAEALEEAADSLYGPAPADFIDPKSGSAMLRARAAEIREGRQ